MADKIKMTESEAADWVLGKLRAKKEGPVKGQVKGPIFKGPPTIVVCPMCSATFGSKEHPVIGVPANRQKAHLESHKAGLIVKVADAG